jgi:hypothetical protein
VPQGLGYEKALYYFGRGEGRQGIRDVIPMFQHGRVQGKGEHKSQWNGCWLFDGIRRKREGKESDADFGTGKTVPPFAGPSRL